VVFASKDFIPRRQDLRRDVGGSSFNSAAMLGRVGASNLDVENSDSRPIRDFSPCVSRNRNWIDTIRNDGEPEREIVFCHRVCDAITGIIHRFDWRRRIAKGLLNRVDPQVHGIDFSRELASDA
jgi:hypothetical protein